MDAVNDIQRDEISIFEELTLRIILQSGRGVDEKFPVVAIRPRFEALCFAGITFAKVISSLTAKGLLESEGEFIRLTPSGLAHVQR